MAIPRKGSRKIVVDSVEYRWLIRRKATYNQSDYGVGKLHVAIEGFDQSGATLLVETNRPHPKDIDTDQPISIEPSDIVTWIHTAIAKGWTPTQPGPTFRLKDAR